MSNRFVVQEGFTDWFDANHGFQILSERLWFDLEHLLQLDPQKRFEIMRQWLLAAYTQGADDMAQDTLATLGDYATVFAGIDERCWNRTEGFDAAAENLREYYQDVFDLEIFY
jgi:hypothetical protein